MELDEMEAELVGALIGEGYISLASKKYILGFVGHPKNDFEYHKYLSKLIFNLWNKKPRTVIRARGLRTKGYSKQICNHLIKKFDLCVGYGKAKKIKIPKKILFEWKLLKYCIRGIVDTDGSVFYSKKQGVEKYPSIELTTISFELANQLKTELLKQGFNVANIRKYKWKKAKNYSYKVCLYGKRNLNKWINEIGFSNPIKNNKAKVLSEY